MWNFNLVSGHPASQSAHAHQGQSHAPWWRRKYSSLRRTYLWCVKWRCTCDDSRAVEWSYIYRYLWDFSFLASTSILNRWNESPSIIVENLEKSGRRVASGLFDCRTNSILISTVSYFVTVPSGLTEVDWIRYDVCWEWKMRLKLSSRLCECAKRFSRGTVVSVSKVSFDVVFNSQFALIVVVVVP